MTAPSYRPVTADEVAAKLEATQTGANKWQAICPAHDDRTPSLSITDDDGKLLLKCFAGCEFKAILSAAGFGPNNGNGRYWPKEAIDINQLRRQVKERFPGTEEQDEPPNNSSGTRRIVATYDYTDANGKLLYQVVRYDPKDFRQRRPDGNGGWIWNLKGVQPVLYRLPKVINAKLVYVTEGEKDVKSVGKLGRTATCNSGGAGKWKPEHSAVLKGKQVVIIPDNDEPGREHAETVSQSVYDAGAEWVKVVTLPPEVKDITEWVEAGGTREQLIAMVKAAPKYQPPVGTTPGDPALPDAGDLVTVRADAVVMESVSWLWPGRIARGKLNLIAGDPGLAKSTLTISIAAVVTGEGGRWGLRLWPDGTRCGPASNVVFLSAEDDAEDTIVPRLKAAGADLSRVHIVQSVLRGYTGDATPVEKLFSLQTDLQALDRKLGEIGNVSLLVIDPVTAYLDGVDSYKNSEVRGVLAPLRTLARKHNTAALLNTHVNKDGAKAMMKVSGSLAFVAAARTAYLVTEDPLDPKNRRLLLSLKNNLGPAATGLAYTVETAQVRCPTGLLKTATIAWEDSPVAITAQEALNQTRGTGSGEELGPKEKAVLELLDIKPDLKPAEIAAELGWKDVNTRNVLQRLREKKKVKSHHGSYRLADPA